MKETKLQPGTAGPGNRLGCCLISFHFLWAILCPQAVDRNTIIYLNDDYNDEGERDVSGNEREKGLFRARKQDKYKSERAIFPLGKHASFPVPFLLFFPRVGLCSCDKGRDAPQLGVPFRSDSDW